MHNQMVESPVMKEGDNKLQEHGASCLGGRPSTLHALVHCAALPQSWRGLYCCRSKQTLQAVAQHVQQALTGCIECLSNKRLPSQHHHRWTSVKSIP